MDVTKIRIIDDVNTTIENLVKSEFAGGVPFDLSFAVPRKQFTPLIMFVSLHAFRKINSLYNSICS